jgi:hypothetical protein
MRRPPPFATALVLLLAACSPAQDAATPAVAQGGCLPGDAGFLRARLRGAIEADIEWRNAQMTCEGSPRPDAAGLRLTIAGPLDDTGRVLRFVFGIEGVGQDSEARNLATNLTVILEGQQALYATRGDDKCSLDARIDAAADGLAPGRRRVDARGFCTGPAASMDGTQRLVVERFDFASQYSTEEPH